MHFGYWKSIVFLPITFRWDNVFLDGQFTTCVPFNKLFQPQPVYQYVNSPYQNAVQFCSPNLFARKLQRQLRRIQQYIVWHVWG